MSDTPEQRDKIIARLAAAALRSGAQAGAACPDAELLAAYADRSLNAAEVEKWEAHFAACTQCRQVLALLAASSWDSIASGLASGLASEPALEDVQRVEQLVAAAASPSTAPTSIQSPARPPRRSKLWLVPLGVMGAAAALVLWLALRPAAPPTQTVAGIPPSAAPGPSSPAANSAPPNPSPANAQPSNSQSSGSEIAQTGIPPIPATASPAAKRSEPPPALGREFDEAKQESPAKKAQEADALAAPAPAPPENSATGDSIRPTASAGVGVTGAPATSGSAGETNTASNAAPRSTAQPPVTVTTEIPRLETGKNTPSAAPPGAASANQPASRAAGQPAVLAVAGTASALSNGTVAGLAKTTNPGSTFAAPGGELWRVGPAGRIERSGDKGATWQPQSSGVTSDLLAGVAVSGQVAWAVGRAGIILRTTDGETWQRVPPPNGLMLDWTGIQAADALHATVTSGDLRRFTTADGGRSWTQQ